MIPTGIPQKKMNGMITPTFMEIHIENIISHQITLDKKIWKVSI